MSDKRNEPEMEIIEDASFSFDGFQVVRGEFFAHIYEPSFTFNNHKCSVNTACIKKLSETDYVQILVNPDEKKLAVRPCGEDAKDSVRWCSATSKRSPKQITCRMFFAKVFSLMDWDIKYRYRLLGKLIRSGSELLFVFDLNSPEIFTRKTTDEGKTISSRTPVYKESWKNQFGLPYNQHQEALQVGLFNQYTVFALAEPKKESKKTSAEDPADLPDLPVSETVPENTDPPLQQPIASEEVTYEQLELDSIGGTIQQIPAESPTSNYSPGLSTQPDKDPSQSLEITPFS